MGPSVTCAFPGCIVRWCKASCWDDAEDTEEACSCHSCGRMYCFDHLYGAYIYVEGVENYGAARSRDECVVCGDSMCVACETIRGDGYFVCVKCKGAAPGAGAGTKLDGDGSSVPAETSGAGH